MTDQKQQTANEPNEASAAQEGTYDGVPVDEYTAAEQENVRRLNEHLRSVGGSAFAAAPRPAAAMQGSIGGADATGVGGGGGGGGGVGGGGGTGGT